MMLTERNFMIEKVIVEKENCSEFIETGLCMNDECRKRHPRKCRYDQRSICKRGESCRYLHEISRRKESESCDLCEFLCSSRYFCEFCIKSFCSKCTIEEAHMNQNKIQ